MKNNQVRLPIVTRPVVILVFILIMVVAVVTSFAAGSHLKSPELTALNAVDESVPVTTEVVSRVLNDSAPLQGTVSPGDVFDIAAPTIGAGERTIMSSNLLSVGDYIESGSVIGTVSGRPIIIVGETVPLYRPMRIADKGPDVEAFNTQLMNWGHAISDVSTINTTTMKAVEYIYTGLGLESPKDGDARYIDYRDFFQLPGNKGEVIGIASVGSQITVENPIARVQTTPDTITARADLSVVDSFSVGQVVEINASGNILHGSIASVSAFREGDADNSAGKDLIIASPDLTLTPGTSLTISRQKSESPVLALPLTALREDSGVTYVRVRTDEFSEGSPIDVDVPVVILIESDGWFSFEPNDELSEGTNVIVGDV